VGAMGEATEGREVNEMRIGVSRTFGLAVLLAGLACLSFVDGQEAEAPAPEWLNSLRGRAEKGDAKAQARLGSMYAVGRGVPQDYAEAARWFRNAAEQGEVGAQAILGFLYLSGQGVPQDYAEAARWYRKAAEQGHSFAQTILGSMYHSGRGVPQDYAEAARWFRNAADQGQVDAQLFLRGMYYDGKGVPQDYVEAYMWLNLAASRATGDDLKKYTEVRETVAAKMTPQQIAEAQRRAREWKPKSGESTGGRATK